MSPYWCKQLSIFWSGQRRMRPIILWHVFCSSSTTVMAPVTHSSLIQLKFYTNFGTGDMPNIANLLSYIDKNMLAAFSHKGNFKTRSTILTFYTGHSLVSGWFPVQMATNKAESMPTSWIYLFQCQHGLVDDSSNKIFFNSSFFLQSFNLPVA